MWTIRSVQNIGVNEDEVGVGENGSKQATPLGHGSPRVLFRKTWDDFGYFRPCLGTLSRPANHSSVPLCRYKESNKSSMAIVTFNTLDGKHKASPSALGVGKNLVFYGDSWPIFHSVFLSRFRPFTSSADTWALDVGWKENYGSHNYQLLRCNLEKKNSGNM